MGQLTATRFRVTNFRNIDDRVTAFVGRNESGKTALLKALRKSNPAPPEAFSPQHEFPRDRYTREFKKAADWPVCAIEFQIGPDLRAELAKIAGSTNAPEKVTYTTYYDGDYDVAFTPMPAEDEPRDDEVVLALNSLRGSAMSISGTGEQGVPVQATRTDLLNWADVWKEKFSGLANLKVENALASLKTLRQESNGKANPLTASAIETPQRSLERVSSRG